MSNMIVIRKKEQYWNDFIVDGFNKGLSRDEIRDKLLDAFRKEVFEQMMWRLNVVDLSQAPQTGKNIEIVKSIAEQTRKRWGALIRMCDEHLKTLNLLKAEDLQEIFPEVGKEDDEDDGYEFEETEEETDEEDEQND